MSPHSHSPAGEVAFPGSPETEQFCGDPLEPAQSSFADPGRATSPKACEHGVAREPRPLHPLIGGWR